MSRTINTTMDWIDDSTTALTLFLQSYVQTPEEGALSNDALNEIGKLIIMTAEQGTNEQKKILYLLLIRARSYLRENNHPEMFTPISQLTRLFKHRCPNETGQFEQEILNAEPTARTSRAPVSAA